MRLKTDIVGECKIYPVMMMMMWGIVSSDVMLKS